MTFPFHFPLWKPLFLTFFLLLQSCLTEDKLPVLPLVPRPAQIEQSLGYLTLPSLLVVEYDNKLFTRTANFASQFLGRATRVRVTPQEQTKPSPAAIFFKRDRTVSHVEGYRLEITSSGVVISSNTNVGAFYGFQTLRQLLPSFVERPGGATGETLRLPFVKIEDEPRFKWRGMMLDVARHFFSKDYIKKYIAYLSAHKMNRLHLHLVDNQGWRVEIRKYPNLSRWSAWRRDPKHGDCHNTLPTAPKDKQAKYGGYYSRSDIQEIIRFATRHHVTVVPEIEMPAHSAAALIAYPQYACHEDPTSELFCAGQKETFVFLQNVLDEVLYLFPSKYVHIGGNEADKTPWKTCKNCQQRMEVSELKNEEELQSYFIKRIGEYLKSKNRVLLGWDEILEGGLAPDAIVMAWRSEQNGVSVAQKKHFVIMSPGSHCSFDYYQGEQKYEPPAKDGYVPLKTVYHYDPIPSSLKKEDEKYILGAQANLWTEYLFTPQQVEYMTFPRLSALSEVVWSPREARNYEDFTKRLEVWFQRMKTMGIKVSQSALLVQSQGVVQPSSDAILVKLFTEFPQTTIYYTLDGSPPSTSSEEYTRPFLLKETTKVRAMSRLNRLVGKATEHTFELHKAVGKKVLYKHRYNSTYKASGMFALVDGVSGSLNHSDKRWQGFRGDDLSIVIDLDSEQSVESISLSMLSDPGMWIFPPAFIKVEASNDGDFYRVLDTFRPVQPQEFTKPEKKTYQTILSPVQSIRYIRLMAANHDTLPSWHRNSSRGTTGEGWLFVDEIKVE